MSAIWGIIGRNGTETDTLFEKMTAVTKKYKIDRTETVKAGNASFACGHAHITKEAFSDVSPVYDKESGVLFTADAFLTNRDDLIASLVQKTGASLKYDEMGDANLCFLALKAFGDGFVNKLRGAFAMAVYYEKTNKLALYTDPLSRRYLAYHVEEDFVCFSSTYEPIKKCLKKVELSERCICEFYAGNTPRSFRSPDLTVYKDVFHVNCAQVVSIDLTSGKKTEKTYYVVGSNQKPFKISDEECKTLFIDTYRKTVKSLLRSSGETGVLLSGGLDSSSAAALAAEELAKEGKKLYSYTMIPASGYEYVNSRTISENEKPHVEAQKELHPNIVTNYVTGDDGCIFTRLNEYTEFFEGPVKVGNIDNIIRMMKEADKANCKLMLGGANGNASVSYGSICLLLSHYVFRLRFIKAYKALKAFCRARHIPRKKLVTYYLEGFKDFFAAYSNYKLDSFVKKDLCRKYRLKSREKKGLYDYGTDVFATKRQRKNFIYNDSFYQHTGYYDTYTSLMTGVYSADPTETVEMIELCLRIPIEYQVKGDVERRTIREYMKEHLPECVTSIRVGRGIQAADIEYCVNRDWQGIKAEVLHNLNNAKLLDYMEQGKVRELGERAEHGEHIDRMDILKMYSICSLGSFLYRYEE